jgi:hypothetical protein
VIDQEHFDQTVAAVAQRNERSGGKVYAHFIEQYIRSAYLRVMRAAKEPIAPEAAAQRICGVVKPTQQALSIAMTIAIHQQQLGEITPTDLQVRIEEIAQEYTRAKRARDHAAVAKIEERHQAALSFINA